MPLNKETKPNYHTSGLVPQLDSLGDVMGSELG